MSKNDSKLYDRRFCLRSASSCIALPFLQSLVGSRILGTGGLMALAGNASRSQTSAAVGKPTSPSGIPKRLVFLPMGYGVNAENWFPSVDQPGANYDLPPLVQSFQDLKSDISFIQNLKCARIPNPHSGTANFLTCNASKAFKDRNFKNSISCDQLAAEVLGKDTRFDYLAMGAVRRADGHGGLASYGQDGKPVGVHRSMMDLYTTLFGAGGKAGDIRAKLARQQSSLDALLSDAKKLNRQVSAEDRDRVDEYFTSIRNIENRLTKAQQWADTPYPDAPFKYAQVKGKGEDIELVFDMMVTAMLSESTRVLSYMLPTQPVLRGMNPHRMSHQASGEFDPTQPKTHQQRDMAFAKLVSGFIRKLKQTKEADGSSLLEHSLIAYGTCLRQGHSVSNGPLILAGHGGGGLQQGQNVVCKPGSTPLANLWLSMIRHIGVPQEKFANSNGVLQQIGFA